MFRKVSREKAKDQEKIFLLERKATACLEDCLTACTGPGCDTYAEERRIMCEAP